MAKTHPDQPETPADIGKIRRVVNGASLPTVTVRPSYLDIINATDPGTPGYTGPRTPQRGSSYALRFATGALGPMTAGQAAALRAPEIAARQNAALDEAAAAPARSEPAPAVLDGAVTPPPTYPYGPGHGLKRLAPGVSRYALGGDIAGPNATPIYTTRGKHGEAVFTDDAGYAASQSTGGLRRGEVNADVYANAQENAKTNPNAGYEFAPSTINTSGIAGPNGQRTPGLSRRDFMTFDPAATDAALATAQSGIDNTEQGLSNRMDANLLRARRITQQQQAAEGAQSLDPRTQIALMRAQTAAAQGAERNDIARDALEETRRARTTAQQNADRQSEVATQKMLAETPPDQLPALLVAKINAHADDLDQWKKTAEGQQILHAFLTGPLRQGALRASGQIGHIISGAVSDPRYTDRLRYSDLNFTPEGGFGGLNRGGENVYPTTKDWLSRLLTPGSSVFGTDQNFDPAVYQLQPKILKQLYLDDRQELKQNQRTRKE